MLSCFFNSIDAIHFEFVPEGTAVNQTFYVEVLKRPIYAVRCKRGELRWDLSLILHYYNAPTYSSVRRKRHLCHGSSALLSWHGSSWLLAASKTKSLLKGERFSNDEVICGKNFDRQSCSGF
jgi:hypothetical protein